MNTSAQPSPRVSVVLSTYNRAALLPRAIESVLQQDYKSLELVVIDDCSSDGTAELLAQWATDDRVLCIRNSRNLGLPASLNRGIRRASGSLLARIDDDDHWQHPDKLTQQVKFLESHPGHVLVGSAYIDEWGREIQNPLEDEAIRGQMLFRCPFCHSSIVMRREAFEAAGGYDESIPYGEDWELWMRLGQQGELANLSTVTLIKSQGENTMSERFFKQQLASASAFVGQHGGHYPGAFRARFMHGFSRLFFTVVPANGGVHKVMQKQFQRHFRLRDGGR